MILCTKNSDALVRSAVNRDQKNSVSIIKYQDMLDKLMIDPMSGPSPIDAFIISNVDLKGTRAVDELLECLDMKHPNAKVIFINKTGKPLPIDGNTPGIDYYFTKPKPLQLRDAIYAVAAKLTEKPVVHSAAEEAAALKPAESSVDIMAMLADPGAMGEPEEEREVPSGVSSEEFEDIIASSGFTGTDDVSSSSSYGDDGQSEIVQRAKAARSVGDLAALTRELSAEELLKKLAQENHNYEVLETKIRTLRDRANEIMYSNSGMTLPERYEKIGAVLYDANSYSVASSTLVEQYIREILETITKKAGELLNEELDRINESIKQSVTYGQGQMDFGRLAGINEERGNAVLAMKTIEMEIQEIGIRCADMVDEIVKKQCEEAENPTESPIVNTRLEQMGVQLRSGDFIEILKTLLELAQNVSTDFLEYTHKATVMIEEMRKLLHSDEEQIAAMAQLVKMLQSKDVTDTVVANTLLKKSLRIFIGREGTGRSIVPYCLSRFKSRENANVLHVDLTGTCKLENYGVKAYTIDDYKANRYEEQFCVVVGELNSIDDAQALTAMLTRAADYYRVINVVMDPEDIEFIDVLATDVLCINIMTDSARKNMEWAKQALEDFNYDNVARRLICNKCSISAMRLCSYLEMFDVNDVQVLMIKYLNMIEAASFDGADPTSFTTVAELMKEVRRYA